MKCFSAENKDVKDGIIIATSPYPHVVLGCGGNKRDTRIALGRQDADSLVETRSTEEPTGCYGRDTGKHYMRKVELAPAVYDAGVLALKDKVTNEPNGQYLIVSPRGKDNRALVRWSVESGYRGSVRIEGGGILAQDSAWHSGRGSLGENGEVLAVLSPGDSLLAYVSGRHVQNDRARLTWNGQVVTVEFFDAAADPDGDYV